jgi:hypothetical protein
MEITRISSPKFKVGRYTLNEYEVRNLMLEVAQGIKPSGIVIKDAIGGKAEILDSGYLSEDLCGLSISDSLALKLHRLQRTK